MRRNKKTVKKIQKWKLFLLAKFAQEISMTGPPYGFTSGLLTKNSPPLLAGYVGKFVKIMNS